MDIKIITLNANGLRCANKRSSLMHWLSHLSASIICLQETHVSSVFEPESWFSSYDFQVACSPSSILSCGTVLLFRPAFNLCNVRYDAGAALCCVSSPFVNAPSGSVASILQTVILIEMISLIS